MNARARPHFLGLVEILEFAQHEPNLGVVYYNIHQS